MLQLTIVILVAGFCYMLGMLLKAKQRHRQARFSLCLAAILVLGLVYKLAILNHWSIPTMLPIYVGSVIPLGMLLCEALKRPHRNIRNANPASK
jgi:peptidoglycan/LPS O-acetylase OafA/YrhL